MQITNEGLGFSHVLVSHLGLVINPRVVLGEKEVEVLEKKSWEELGKKLGRWKSMTFSTS